MTDVVGSPSGSFAPTRKVRRVDFYTGKLLTQEGFQLVAPMQPGRELDPVARDLTPTPVSRVGT